MPYEIIQTLKYRFLVTKDQTYGPAPRTYFTAWLPMYPFIILDQDTLDPDDELTQEVYNTDKLPAMWIDDAFSREELKAKLELKYGVYND